MSVCYVRALWPNGWTDQDETWRAGRPRHGTHCVRWGPSLPPQKGGGGPSLIFGLFLLWPNGWMHQDATCMEVGLSPGDFVLDGDAALLPKMGQSPQFSAHVYCGQTARCINMPLGMDLGLSPDDIMLDGYPVHPPQKGDGPPSPIFGPCLFWPHGWAVQDGTWRGGIPWSRHIVLDVEPAPFPQKGAEPPPQFWAHLYCCQAAGCIKMPLGMEVSLGPGNFVLHGDPVPSPKRGGSPQFSAHVYCGQTAAWMKMPVGTEVGLGPNDVVLHEDPPPPQKGHTPQFSAHVYCGQTGVCIRIPLGTEVGLSLGDIVLDGDPAFLP